MPFSRDLSDPGIEPTSLMSPALQAGSCLEGKKSACSAGDLSSIPGSERSLEKGMATHSSIFVWEIPWTEEPGGYSPWCCRESDMTE